MKRSHILAMLAVVTTSAALFAQTVPAPGAPAAGGGRGRGAGAQPGGGTAPDVATMRKEWVDADTGHRVHRLSVENGSANLYFHYNAYSADGKKVVFNSPSGIMACDLATRQAQLIVPGQRSVLETSRTTNEVFYNTGNAIMAANLDTKATRQVVAIPNGMRVNCVNSDGTLFAGIIDNIPHPEGNDKAAKPDSMPGDQYARMFPGKRPEDLTPEQRSSTDKENRLTNTLRNHITQANPHCLFTLNAKTNEVKRFGYAYAWLGHLQFSPTNPNLLMFCHEGTWHEVNRVWVVDVSQPNAVAKAMHERTMNMEIWGHEWWNPDGKSVGFDLQTPRSAEFWIAKVDLTPDNGPAKETKYKLDKNWWGVHFFPNKDTTMYASDGGDPAQVAFAPDGQWINLLRVTKPAGGADSLSREKLVNMSKHNYVTSQSSPGNTGVEPNVTFTPDDKYVIFGGNFDGARHVYMVEIAKATQ